MKNCPTLVGVVATFMLSITSAHAALIDLHSGQIYDTSLNIVWLQNANLAATNTFGVSGIAADGTMNWNTAAAWIAAMNNTNYLGYNDWRLPSMSSAPLASSIFDCTTGTAEQCAGGGNELGYMNIWNLSGQEGDVSVDGVQLFSIQDDYWSNTIYAGPAHWHQWFGGQVPWVLASANVSVWAVRDVPEPSTVPLIAIALLGMLWVQKRELPAFQIRTTGDTH